MNKKISILIIIVLLILVIVFSYLYFSQNLNNANRTGGLLEGELDKSKSMENMLSLKLFEINFDTKIDDENISRNIILILDKDDKVIDSIVRDSGYSTNKLEEKYNNYIGMNTFYSNVSKKDNILYYNGVVWNGNTKEQTISILRNSTNTTNYTEKEL